MRYDSTQPFGLPRRNLYFAFVGVCATVMAVSGFPALEVALWRIAQAPATAVGVVTHLDCPEHGHVDYRFAVDGATVSGANLHIDGVDCRRLHIGQRIGVSYARGAPQNNYAFPLDNRDGARADHEFWKGVATMAAFVLLGPAFLVFVATLFNRISTSLGLRKAARIRF